MAEKITEISQVKTILERMIQLMESGKPGDEEEKPEEESDSEESSEEEKPENDEEEPTEKATFTDVAWNTPESSLEAGAFCSVCLVDLNESGTEKVKSKCYLPIRSRPGGPINKNALRNAAARLSQTNIPSTEKEKARKRLVSLMNQAGIDTNLDKSANVIDHLISIIHRSFTERADYMYGDGVYTQEDHIALSNIIGSALDVFNEQVDALVPHLRGVSPFPEIYKSEDKIEKFDNEIDILKYDNEKRLVYAVAYPLMPDGMGDTQMDRIEADEIEKASHNWLIKSRKYDLHHRELNVPNDAAVVVESYIAPIDINYPLPNGNIKLITKGSWIVVTHFPDSEIWKRVKNKEFNAYSIRGKATRKKII